MRFDSLLTKSLFIGIILSTGCMMGEDTSALNGGSSGSAQAGEFDRDNCKIEGSDIGVEGLVLDLGRVSVTFDQWVSKDGEPGEYVGFAISVRGADRVGYVVKASGELYHSTDSTWVHPNGTGGSSAPAISNVDFCENDPNDPANPDDPYCNDPDGCDGNPGSYDPNDPYCNDPDGCGGDPGNYDPNDPYDPANPNDPSDPNDPSTCNDPDGCNGNPGGACIDDLDCGENEFCDDYGVCLPYVE